MHTYTLFLIGAWILGSGVVAYVCDNLGRKLGKRRLSLWGMRPRHTAMVLTVLTGIGIAAVSVGLIALTVTDARVALFQVRSIKQQVKDLKSAQIKLRSDRDDLMAKNSALRANNRSLEQISSEAERLAHENERKAAETERGLKQVVTQRDIVKSALSSARSRFLTLKSSHDSLVRDRDALVREVDQRQTKLDTLRSRLTEQKRLLGVAETRGRTARAKVTELEEQIATETRTLEKIQGRLASVTQNLKLTQQELDERRQELDQNHTNYTMSSVAFRRYDIVYTADQEIARRVIYNPTDPQEVNLQIVKLLDTADQNARMKGADDPRPGYRSVQLAPYQDTDPSGKLNTLDESELILRYRQRIVQEKKDVVLSLVSLAHSFKGEPVQAMLRLYPNQLVFHHGDVIAKERIDGRQSDAKILETLIDLLQNRVRGEAIEKGMLPSPNGSLGDINWEQMLEAVRQIRTSNEESEVQIISQTDAWTADPLMVRFVLQT